MSTPYIALFTMSTLFFLMLPPPPRSTLFPYTTLFRSFEQAKFIFQKVEKALVQAGSSLQEVVRAWTRDRKSTRLNSSHTVISYAVFCLKKKISEKIEECMWQRCGDGWSRQLMAVSLSV